MQEFTGETLAPLKTVAKIALPSVAVCGVSGVVLLHNALHPFNNVNCSTDLLSELDAA